MKVIISCLNSKYVHASLSPWCLLAGIREFSENTYDVLVTESTINGDAESFADKIINENPDVKFFLATDDNMIPVISKIVNEVTGGLHMPDTGVMFSVPIGYTEGFVK